MNLFLKRCPSWVSSDATKHFVEASSSHLSMHYLTTFFFIFELPLLLSLKLYTVQMSTWCVCGGGGGVGVPNFPTRCLQAC